MKYLTALFLLATTAQHVLAELSYTVTATHQGKAIDPSAIKLTPLERKSSPLNVTVHTASSGPPSRPGKPPKSRRALGSSTDSNWCGAVVQTTGSNLISKVHAYFQAPTLSARSGVSSYPQRVGEWVGIDGYTNGVILQSGIGQSISSSGVQSNYGWFQWYPSGAYTISSFPVTAGDWIEVTITATSATSGVVTISNTDQDYTYTVTLTGGTTLSRVSAEWIVEDPASSGGLLPFASFSDVWFEDVYATTTTNANLGIDSSTLLSINDAQCVSVEYDNGDFYAYSSSST